MEKQQLKAPPTQVATGVIIVHNAIPMLAIICISYHSFYDKENIASLKHPLSPNACKTCHHHIHQYHTVEFIIYYVDGYLGGKVSHINNLQSMHF